MRHRPFAFFLSWSFLMIGSARIAAADPISWSGASTSVGLFGQSKSSTGVGSQANLSGSTTIPYYSISYGQNEVTQGQGTASAQINGTPGNLFSLSTSFLSSTLPGGSFQSQPQVESSASWAGDRVLIGSSSGQPEPGMVRLNFSINFTQNGLVPVAGESGAARGNLTATYNNQQSSYEVGDNPWGTLVANQSFDSTSRYFDPSSPSFYSGRLTFHLDLPVNAAGISDPFQVGLNEVLSTKPYFSGTYITSLPDVRLSLDSVTLADGNTPESEGYSVAFASGLASPNAVPEPATFAIFAAGIGVVAARRWRRTIGA